MNLPLSRCHTSEHNQYDDNQSETRVQITYISSVPKVQITMELVKRSEENLRWTNHVIILPDTNLNSGGDGIADDARRGLPCSKSHRRNLSSGIELKDFDSVSHYQRFWEYQFKISGFGFDAHSICQRVRPWEVRASGRGDLKRNWVFFLLSVWYKIRYRPLRGRILSVRSDISSLLSPMWSSNSHVFLFTHLFGRP